MVFKWHLTLWILQKVTGGNRGKKCMLGSWMMESGQGYGHLHNLLDLGFLLKTQALDFFLLQSNSSTLHSSRPKVLPG